MWRRVYLADDWAGLRSAVGLSDDDLAQALRETALYTTLAAAAEAGLPSPMYLEASQTGFDNSLEELQARFPDAPAATLKRLLTDYQQESASVEAQERRGLREFAVEIGRLLEEEVGEQDGMEV